MDQISKKKIESLTARVTQLETTVSALVSKIIEVDTPVKSDQVSTKPTPKKGKE